MKAIIKSCAFSALLLSFFSAPFSSANNYVIDTKGAHAFVQFRVKHLGYSWLYGRFNTFEGEFFFDPKQQEKSKISVTVDMSSLDSNHAERDKHVRSADFLNVKKHGTAKFVSTKYEPTGKKTGKLTGNMTFFGKTKPLVIDVEYIGGGKDPWGGYRQGFEGRAVLNPADYGLDLAASLGPDSAKVELFLTVEGIRK